MCAAMAMSNPMQMGQLGMLEMIQNGPLQYIPGSGTGGNAPTPPSSLPPTPMQFAGLGRPPSALGPQATMQHYPASGMQPPPPPMGMPFSAQIPERFSVQRPFNSSPLQQAGIPTMEPNFSMSMQLNSMGPGQAPIFSGPMPTQPQPSIQQILPPEAMNGPLHPRNGGTMVPSSYAAAMNGPSGAPGPMGSFIPNNSSQATQQSQVQMQNLPPLPMQPPMLPPPPGLLDHVPHLVPPELKLFELNKRMQMRPPVPPPDDLFPHPIPIPDPNQWWDTFASEFFDDDATMTTAFFTENGPIRYSMRIRYGLFTHTTIGRTLIPRWFRCMFESGVVDMYVHVRDVNKQMVSTTVLLPASHPLHPARAAASAAAAASGAPPPDKLLNAPPAPVQRPVLLFDCDNASLITHYTRPLLTSVSADGRLTLEFSIDDVMRIRSWTFLIYNNDEMVPRSSISTLRNALEQHKIHLRAQSSAAGDGASELARVVQQHQAETTMFMNAVQNNITPRAGLTAPLLKFLTVAAILEPMQLLMTRHKSTGAAPRDCLQAMVSSFAQQMRDNPGALPMPPGACGPPPMMGLPPHMQASGGGGQPTFPEDPTGMSMPPPPPFPYGPMGGMPGGSPRMPPGMHPAMMMGMGGPPMQMPPGLAMQLQGMPPGMMPPGQPALSMQSGPPQTPTGTSPGGGGGGSKKKGGGEGGAKKKSGGSKRKKNASNADASAGDGSTPPAADGVAAPPAPTSNSRRGKKAAAAAAAANAAASQNASGVPTSPGASNQSGELQYPMGVRMPDGMQPGMGLGMGMQQMGMPTLGEMMIVQEPTLLGSDPLGLGAISDDERIITRIENPAMQLMQQAAAGQMPPPHMMMPPPPPGMNMNPNGELSQQQQQFVMMQRQQQMQMQMQMQMPMQMQMQMQMPMSGPMPLPMHMQPPLDMPGGGAPGGQSAQHSALASLLDQPHYGQPPQSLPQQQQQQQPPQSVPRPGSASISDPYAYPASFAPPTPGSATGPMPGTPGRVAPAPSAPQAQSQQTPQSVPPTVNSGGSSASGSSANSTPNGVASTGGRDRPGSRPQSRPSLTPTPKLEPN